MYRHLTDIIVEEMPDVVLLQEVRLDGAFAPKMPQDTVDGKGKEKKIEVGSQVEHLLQAIRNSAKSTNSDKVNVQMGSELFQIVYQPAMLLQEL